MNYPVRTTDIGVGISRLCRSSRPASIAQRPGIRHRAAGTPRPPQDAGGARRSVRGCAGAPGFGFGALSDQPDQPAGIFLMRDPQRAPDPAPAAPYRGDNSGELPEGKPTLKPDQCRSSSWNRLTAWSGNTAAHRREASSSTGGRQGLSGTSGRAFLMLYTYAIEPNVLVTWDKCRLTLNLMGFQHGRAIAAYPSWKPGEN